jgi:hypothetical protein
MRPAVAGAADPQARSRRLATAPKRRIMDMAKLQPILPTESDPPGM